jgi:branched-chain amino acid transport system substrate-binding protein
VTRRTAALLACALLAVCLPRAATAAPDPVTINVILSQSGPAAFLGQTETKSLAILEGVLNAQGGIRGRPVHFAIADDGSLPATAVQLFNQIATTKPSVLLGTGFTATCNAIQPLVRDNGPVMYCLSPSMSPVPGGYAFAGSVATYYLARVMLRYFGDRGWKRIAVITSTDASGTEFATALNAALAGSEGKNLTLVDSERFNVADVSVAGQMAKIKANTPDVLITWTAGSGFGTLLHGIEDGGLALPIVACNCNMIQAQLAHYASFFPKELYFPGVRPIVEGAVADGPVRNAQTTFFAAMKAAGVLRPDMAYILPWDPALVLVDALRHVGPNATADQVRAYLEASHGFAGINGLYDFRDNLNRGIGENNAMMTKWNPDTERFLAVSKPGGHIK